MKIRTFIMLSGSVAFNSAFAWAEIIKIPNNETFTESYSVGQSTVVDVENSNGQVHVLASDSDQFIVEAEATGFQNEAEVELIKPTNGQFKFKLIQPATAPLAGKQGNIFASGSEISIQNVRINGVSYSGSGSGIVVRGNRVTFGGHSVAMTSPQLNVTLYIPKSVLSDTHIKTSNAEISLKGFVHEGGQKSDRKIELITSNSSIEITEVSGKNILAKSSNGSVKVSQCQGNLDLTTSNGSITVSDHSGGRVVARTSNANINFNSPEVNSADEEGTTSNGNIKYTRRVATPLESSSSTSSGSSWLYQSLKDKDQ